MIFPDTKNFDDDCENLIVVTLPSQMEDGSLECIMSTLCLEKKDEDRFSEHYEIFLYELTEANKLVLTDHFDAKFMGGKPTEYAKNLGASGIFGAFLNKNVKNLEEKIRFIKNLFYAY